MTVRKMTLQHKFTLFKTNKNALFTLANVFKIWIVKLSALSQCAVQKSIVVAMNVMVQAD